VISEARPGKNGTRNTQKKFTFARLYTSVLKLLGFELNSLDF